MKYLALEKSGEQVLVGHTYPIVNGVLANRKGENMVVVSKIVMPTDENPRGMIHCNPSSDGLVTWRECYPEVIGAAWREPRADTQP